MDTVYTIMRYFFLVGAVASAVYFSLIINRKNKHIQDKIFAIWFLFTAIDLFIAFYIEELSTAYPVAFGILIFVFTIVHNPFLFLYIREITIPTLNTGVSYLRHFLPVIVIALIVIFWYSNKTYEEQVLYNDYCKRGYLKDIPFLVSITIINAFLSLFYIVWSWLLIHKHQRKIKNIFSDIQNISLRWTEYFTIFLGFIWVFAIILIFVLLMADGSISVDIFYFGVTIYIPTIFYFGFNAKRQRQIFVSLNDKRSYYDLDESENASSDKKFTDDEE